MYRSQNDTFWSSMFIAFEGPTGVGKTTLARATSQALDAHFFPDPFEKVTRFGENLSVDALATETEFLFHRLVQLQAINKELNKSRKTIITDWDLRKIQYFAKEQLKAYDYEILLGFAQLEHRAIRLQRIELP